MIQKVEFIKFKKKPQLNIAKETKNQKDKKNYSLKKEKEYSQLYIKILNSNKSSNINRIKSTANINYIKKDEKQINLFDSIECKNIYSSQCNINKSSSTNKKEINKKNCIKLNKNINNKICSKKKNKNKKKLISNKTISKLEKNIKNNFNSKEKESNFNNQRLKIPYNKDQQLIKSRNLKKFKENEQKSQIEKVETKTNMIPKEKTHQRQIDEVISYNKSKQIIKNNIKIKKVDILNDNNVTLESNKEKNNANNHYVNYIFTKKLKKNYEIKLQNSPKFGGSSQKIAKMNNSIMLNKNKRKIKESNTIDSYINKNYLKSDKDNKILNKENGKERRSLNNNYLNDNSKSIRKLSNNKTDMNTMNSTRLVDIQSPFDLNRNSIKIIKSNSLRNQKKKLINKSAKIKLKIKKSFKNNKAKKFKEENFIKNIKYINLNFKNKSNSKRIVDIKVKNIDGVLSDENEKLKAIYPATDSDFSLLDEKSNNYRRRFYSVRKEISLSKERDKRRENSSMRLNKDINNAEKKLSSLVRDFHNNNNLNDFDKNLSLHKSRKLIDRIRMKKKLNLM